MLKSQFKIGIMPGFIMGNDIHGAAKTGSDKTLAFLVPVL